MLIRILISILCFVGSIRCYCAYADPIDSLKAILENTRGATANERAKMQIEIGLEYARQSQLNQSLLWLEAARELTSDSIILCKAFRGKAQVLWALERFTEAKAAAQMILTHYRKGVDPFDIIVCNNVLGLACSFTGDYDNAFKYYYKSLVLSQKNNLSHSENVALINIGLNYYKMCDYKMAIKYFHLAEHDCDDRSQYFFVKSNLALAYAFDNRSDLAFQPLKELFNRKGEMPIANLIAGYYAYGVAFQKMNLLDSAGYSFQKSLKLCDSINNSRYSAENNVSLANIYLTNDNYSEAARCLDLAEGIALANSYKDISVRVCKAKVALARLVSNPMKICNIQRQYIEKKNDLFNKYLAQIIAGRKATSYEKEYESAILNHRQIMEENRLHEKYNRKLANVEYIIVGLLMVIIFLSIHSLKVSSVNNRQLKKLINQRVITSSQKLHELTELIDIGYKLKASYGRLNFNGAFRLNEFSD
jgi:tetratricopeptide (TPR) repeat protein